MTKNVVALVRRFPIETAAALFAVVLVVRYAGLSWRWLLFAVAVAVVAVAVGRRVVERLPFWDTQRVAAQALALSGVRDEDGNAPRVYLERARSGFLLNVQTPRGVADATVYDRAGVLASALRCRVVPAPDLAQPGHALFRASSSDFLNTVIPSHLALGDAQNIAANPVVLGVTEDGDDAVISLAQQTVLVGGSPGAGKSVALWSLMLATALDESAVLVIVDLKPSAIETAPLHPRAAAVATTPAEALRVFKSVFALIEARNRTLKERNLEKAPLEARREFPQVVVFVDEAAELVGDEGAEALEMLRRIVAVGRASSVSVVLCTQKPEGSAIPTSLRDLLAQRVCFRVGNRAAAETVLGVLKKNDGVEPWRISKSSPGVGYVVAENGANSGFTRFRAALLTRDDAISVCHDVYPRRRRWLDLLGVTEADCLPMVPEPVEDENAPKRQRRRR